MLFFPVAMTLFSASLLAFVERLFLARYSMEGMEVALTVSYFSRLFYLPCMAVPLMSQAIMSYQVGSGEKRLVGACTWQMIWFCLLSALITIPLGRGLGPSYFSGTPITSLALPYFNLLLPLFFLYPLNAAFSAFYIAIGKARFYLISNLTAHVLHLGLCYLFIFGWGEWIHPMGVMGAGLATLIAECGLCFLLLTNFLKESLITEYQTNNWRFKLSLFWKYTFPGLVRFGTRIIVTLSWAFLTWYVSHSGEGFLLAFSVGGTLAIFITFVGEALSQIVTTMASRFLGAREFYSLGKLYHAGVFVWIAFSLLLAVPTLLFPNATMAFLFSPEKCLEMGSMIVPLLLGTWVYFAVFTFNQIPMGFVFAHQDVKYMIIFACITWAETLSVYKMIESHVAPAEYLWGMIACAILFWETALLYLKMRSLNKSVLGNAITSEMG
ncbi:MAG: hypothetical protein JSR58_01250 [Verrucomicrobia bacterium]|nr:hypothetical protein [Verrucomicrobiota bacterium]